MKFTLSATADDSFRMTEECLNIYENIKDSIYDINLTCHTSLFNNDAHGVKMTPQQSWNHINEYLPLLDKGIELSLLFNNIYVPPTLENLVQFIKDLKPYYDLGIRSITLPHLLWLKFGLLQIEFPDLKYKDTVLRPTLTAQDFWHHAEEGFIYVNLDRRLTRNLNELRKIKKAQTKFFEKTGRYVNLSLLISEGCFGNCSLWVEHYQHTLQSKPSNSLNIVGNNIEFIQDLHCNKRYNNYFKSTLWTVFKEDFEELISYIDVVKYPGRRIKQLESTLSRLLLLQNEIEKYKNISDNEIFCMITVPFNPKMITEYIKNSDGSKINVWRKTIKNCNYQCWDCMICDDLMDDLVKKRTNFIKSNSIDKTNTSLIIEDLNEKRLDTSLRSIIDGSAVLKTLEKSPESRKPSEDKIKFDWKNSHFI